MSKMPMPPLTNRQASATSASVGPLEYSPPVPPQPPTPFEASTPNGKLTENETMFILRTSLLPEHHEDPAILKFIASYVRCRSTNQASREANLPPNAGYHLRARPDIHQAITRITEKSLNKYGFDATEVVERVKEISNIDPIEFENPDGSFKIHMKDIAPESRRAIKKFKCKNLYSTEPNGMQIKIGEIIEVELWDKMKSLELLGREKDLFKETTKVQHDVTQRMADVLLDSKRRAQDHIATYKDVTPLALLERTNTHETDKEQQSISETKLTEQDNE